MRNKMNFVQENSLQIQIKLNFASDIWIFKPNIRRYHDPGTIVDNHWDIDNFNIFLFVFWSKDPFLSFSCSLLYGPRRHSPFHTKWDLSRNSMDRVSWSRLDLFHMQPWVHWRGDGQLSQWSLDTQTIPDVCSKEQFYSYSSCHFSLDYYCMLWYE